MIQFQSDPFDIIEARLSQLENVRRNDKTLPTQTLTIPDTSSIVMKINSKAILSI